MHLLQRMTDVDTLDMEQASAICSPFSMNFNKHHVTNLMAKLEHENLELAN